MSASMIGYRVCGTFSIVDEAQAVAAIRAGRFVEGLGPGLRPPVHGDVAACDTCGLTSGMTRRFAEGVAAYMREKAPDWPAARRAIDTAIRHPRREIHTTVEHALWESGADSKRIEELILTQVFDSLDDIDQTIPPEADDD